MGNLLTDLQQLLLRLLPRLVPPHQIPCFARANGDGGRELRQLQVWLLRRRQRLLLQRQQLPRRRPLAPSQSSQVSPLFSVALRWRSPRLGASAAMELEVRR